MGPSYPFQWRHAGDNYVGCDNKYQGIDQLNNVIEGIKNDPYGRRHIISAWDVVNIDKMVLPPCHCFVQFYVGNNSGGEATYLDALLYQRSADMFLEYHLILPHMLYYCI
jgi:thymidylate synthase